MKKWLVLVLGLLLCGCGAQETFETLADEMVLPVSAQPRQVHVELPGEAALPAMESSAGRLYLCRDYEIHLQTLPAGDLDATVKAVSGFPREELTVLETDQGDHKRYDFVWVSTGDEGQQLGKAAVLSDGEYHYCLSVLRQPGEDSQVTWSQVFDSFTLESDRTG